MDAAIIDEDELDRLAYEDALEHDDGARYSMEEVRRLAMADSASRSETENS